MEDTGKKNPLRELSKGSPESGYRYFEIFQRNIGIFTEAQQNVLKNSTVLIAGTGGVGSPCAEILVRMGIGNLILAEFDTFSISNLNRQIPSTVKNIGKHKAEVLAEHLKEIHPFTDIIVVSEGISSANVDKLVGESDIVISSVDSCMIMVLQEALKRNRIMGLTASPLIDEITMTSFPPGGY
jgi:tRNA A37 threonylcarbamoyladenosine dehydratase